MAANAAKPRVYHISIWRYLLLWWVLGPFLLLGLTLPLIDPKSGGAGIAIACLIAPFLLLWHWFVRKTRLEISAEGLRLREVGGGMEVAWADITGFRADRGHEGFITAQPMQSRGAENLAAYAGPMQMHDQRDLQLIGERRFVPIKPFACHLRRGDLREVVASHAPHLREPLSLIDVPPTAAPLTAAGRRRNLLIISLVALGVAIAIPLIGLGTHAQALFFAVAYGVLDPFFAISFIYFAWQQWQTKRPLFAVLTGLFALVMIGWTIANWRHAAQLLHHTP